MTINRSIHLIYRAIKQYYDKKTAGAIGRVLNKCGAVGCVFRYLNAELKHQTQELTLSLYIFFCIVMHFFTKRPHFTLTHIRHTYRPNKCVYQRL